MLQENEFNLHPGIEQILTKIPPSDQSFKIAELSVQNENLILELKNRDLKAQIEKRSFELKDQEHKLEIEKLNLELQEKEKMIQKLKLKCNAHDMNFVSDINLHFTEIYYRFMEIQNQITKTSKEAVSHLHNKYINLQQERKSWIEPLRNNIALSMRNQNNEKWFTRKKTQLYDLVSPKLGKLFHYPPRKCVLPQPYHHRLKKEKLPSISIVTPSFNHGKFLEHTIKSVIDQSYPHLAYILQDGASSDNTLDILSQYRMVFKHCESIQDKGQSHALNMGFKHVTSEIMGYLNSDDILLPGALHYIGKFFATHPEVDVIYGHRILINEDNEEIGRWVLPPHNDEILSWADYIPQETLFWRKRIWDKSGAKIDEAFRFAMDWDLILRFREAGANFVRLPRFLGAFRVHENQKTCAQISQTGAQEMQRLRERCHNRIVSSEEVSNGIRPYLKRHIMFDLLYRMGILRY